MNKTRALAAPLMILATIALTVAWAIFNWPGLLSLHLRWMHFDEPYAIGYPAVLLVLWWGHNNWRELGDRRSRPSIVAVFLLVGALLTGVAAQLVQLQLLQQLVALVSLWLIMTSLLGWPVGRFLLFPAALLALAIPLWDFLVDPLRMLTVIFTQHMLDWLAIPAHINGFTITLPSGVVEVAGGCSGLNLFLAMVLVGLQFAESHLMPRLRRMSIVALAATIGIVDNWVRVFLLVLIAHRTQMQSELVQHHGSFGWWIFAISLVPFFWLAMRIERGGTHTTQIARARVGASQHQAMSISVGVAALLAVFMLTAWAGAGQLENRRGMAEHGLEIEILEFAGLSAPAQAMHVKVMPIEPTWLPQYSGQDITQAWRLGSDKQDYEISALTYLEQRTDKKLIYFSNRIASESAVINSGRLTLTSDFSVNTAVLNVGGGERRNVWWFWWVDGGTSASAFKTKLLQLKATLFGDPSAALIAVSAVCSDASCAEVDSDVSDELRRILLSLQQIRAAK